MYLQNFSTMGHAAIMTMIDMIAMIDHLKAKHLQRSAFRRAAACMATDDDLRCDSIDVTRSRWPSDDMMAATIHDPPGMSDA